MALINPKIEVQKIKLDPDALRLRTPFCMCISGPNQGIFFIEI